MSYGILDRGVLLSPSVRWARRPRLGTRAIGLSGRQTGSSTARLVASPARADCHRWCHATRPAPSCPSAHQAHGTPPDPVGHCRPPGQRPTLTRWCYPGTHVPPVGLWQPPPVTQRAAPRGGPGEPVRAPVASRAATVALTSTRQSGPFHHWPTLVAPPFPWLPPGLVGPVFPISRRIARSHGLNVNTVCPIRRGPGSAGPATRLEVGR